MTREKAIIILGNIPIDGKDKCYSIAEYQEAKTMAIDALKFDIDQYCKEHFVVMVDEDVWDKAEKALEKENVLNEMFKNIKTEIDFIPTYGAKFTDGSINVHVNKKDVLQIIDKYRGVIE